MTQEQIKALMDRRAYPGRCGKVELAETHISWVILDETYAYKIKKPVRYPFLDFSTLEKRRFFCHRELALNSRFTSGMYLQVLPVREQAEGPAIGGEAGPVIDYALQMQRQDNQRQMNTLLEGGAVTVADIHRLARQLASFHAFTDVVEGGIDLNAKQEEFAAILDSVDFIGEQLGGFAVATIREAVALTHSFVQAHHRRFRERAAKGYVVDGHGDLHSRNIFLLDEPVIFDCIEFNDQFRFLDVLDEVAFLCLDLDFFGQHSLAAEFLRVYLAENPCIDGDEDWRIFHYFQLYRANVRLKVTTLQALQTHDETERAILKDKMEEYYFLFREYYSVLRGDETG